MRTFYPRKTKLIVASEPHPKGTQYKVSLGDEDWGDGTFRSVVKVQMMYDGKVDYMFYHLLDNVKVFCDYHKEEGYQLCDKIISMLNELGTDDDTFPQEAVGLIENIKCLHDNGYGIITFQ